MSATVESKKATLACLLSQSLSSWVEDPALAAWAMSALVRYDG
jgi:hypothetical protein